MILQINVSQFKALLRSKKRFALVDTLPETQYAREHIPGAVSIPKDAIEKKAPRMLGKDDLIVVYGKNMKSDSSERAAVKLADLGYKHVVNFPGGLDDYRQTRLPLEGRLHGAGEGN
jgi:rhodanese-related sulfurtransferase